MMKKYIGRKIVCECEILRDPKEVKRKRLEAAFGVDFGELGKMDLDVL
jgi:AMMECR1 domain-containing protein